MEVIGERLQPLTLPRQVRGEGLKPLDPSPCLESKIAFCRNIKWHYVTATKKLIN